VARGYGLRTLIADATRLEVLERVRVRTAACIAITVPDPWTARHIIQQTRTLAPHTPIVVRSRYHVHRWHLTMAGADSVIDEEQEVGVRIAAEVHQRLAERGA
jgi:CPA2 family monovalent cation:H+ antiporter-2